MYVSSRDKLLLNVVFCYLSRRGRVKAGIYRCGRQYLPPKEEKERVAQLVVRKMYICRCKRGLIAIFFPSWFVLSMVNLSPLLE